MTKQPQLGFLGFGKMAEAIYCGLRQADFLPQQNIFCAEANPERIAYLTKKYHLPCLTTRELLAKCQVILICVKPQNIQELFPKDLADSVSDKLFISILAGLRLATLAGFLGTKTALIRVMPNTPATVGAGMSALCRNRQASPAQLKWALALFRCLGQARAIPEKHFDIVTALSGSGPAFFYRLAENMAKAGTSVGLPQETALALLAQTMIGAGHMLKSGRTPAQLIQDVASPGGTTLAGLAAFDQSELDQDLQKVILSAYRRSKELGNA